MAASEKDAKAADGDDDQSMEDILKSIKNIIAEESDEPAAKADDVTEDEETDEVPGSDVLELTEVVDDEADDAVSAEALEADESPAVKKDLDVLDQIDEAVGSKETAKEEPEQEAPVAAPAPKKETPAQVGGSPGDPMLSEEAAAAARASVDKLKQSTEPPPVKTTPIADFASGNTVEGIVASMLRPMIKEWLDTNLPAIVERVVQEEIKRLTK